MKKIALISALIAIAILIAISFQQISSQALKNHARILHQKALVLDTHCDTILRIMNEGMDIGVRSSRGHIDIPRMREGGLDAQVFALWVAPSYLPNGAIRRTLDMLDAMYRTIEQYPDQVELARTAADAYRITSQNKIAIFLGIEGGHAIEDDLAALRMFYRLGVRYLTLTWMNTNNWADAAGDTARWGGLNELGVQVVKEMNRLGMIVDVSHVSDEAFWDVLKVSTKPVIASHSCCRALCNHFRNLSDDMLRGLAQNGGVVGINYYVGYLDQQYNEQFEQIDRELRSQLAALKEKYKDHDQQYQQERRALFQERMKDLPQVSIDRLIDHIDHVVKVAGIDHVGLGSDFDGISTPPVGLEDCSKLPNITQKLLDRGYSDEDITKILGGNFLRVFREVIGE
ncbi:MAG: membrane dipeptidase [candidate division KSB1 bacterium]|nr:membrane dipeptidase [candidate division KSB1 bacterium]